MSPPPTLLSIQVGQPTTYGDDPPSTQKPWTTAFFKSPVAGPVFVTRTGLTGDAQADLQHHGGVDKAVLAYAASHYPLWREELARPDFHCGGFGENLTIEGLTEHTVCIGDVWSLGQLSTGLTGLLQVSQPRQPCWKLARHWQTKELTALVVANGRTGWYLRVLREGTIAPGQTLTLEARPHPQWTVAKAHEVMHHRPHDATLSTELANLPELSTAWQDELRKRSASV